MGSCLSKLFRRRNSEENEQDVVLPEPIELLQAVVPEQLIENREAVDPQIPIENWEAVDPQIPIENSLAIAPQQQKSRSLVIAIDFGTTYTGCAYSFWHDYKIDPSRVSAPTWKSDNFTTEKAPTAVLLTPNKKLKSFGYEALKKYAELSENGKHSEYFLFHRFKMILYTEKNLSSKTTLTDATKKELPALDVFSKMFAFLKQNTIDRLHQNDTNFQIPKDSIHWVVTVPAIWNDKAKQFMRQAVIKAGIEDRSLTLALEPEAAALFCRHLPELRKQSEGKYMVMDLGGGTVDIAIHSVNQNGTFQELCPPTGGYWGGTTVDAQFQQILEKILGREIYEEAKLKQAEGFLELEGNFELKKREFIPNQTNKMKMRIPSEIITFYETKCNNSFRDALEKSEYKNDITLRGDKLFISSKLFQSLFSSSLTSITDEVKKLLSGPAKDIDCILLVGGYADAGVLLSEMRKSFPQKRILKPNDSRLAVLKGAVIFGHEPHVISSRVCSRTYGIAIQTRFDAGSHDKRHKMYTGHGYVCDDVFDIHMNIGDKVKINETRPAKSYFAPPGSTYILLDVFTSTDKFPRYVTEKSCAKLGSVILECDGVNFEVGDMVDVTLNYCGTELGVKARLQRTGDIISARFDFLG